MTKMGVVAKNSPTSVAQSVDTVFAAIDLSSKKSSSLRESIVRLWPRLRDIYSLSKQTLKPIDWSDTKHQELITLVSTPHPNGKHGLDIIMELVNDKFSFFFDVCNGKVTSQPQSGSSSLTINFVMISSYISFIEHVLKCVDPVKIVNNDIEKSIKGLYDHLLDVMDKDKQFELLKLIVHESAQLKTLLLFIIQRLKQIVTLSHDCSVSALRSHLSESIELDIDVSCKAAVDELTAVGIHSTCHIKPSDVRMASRKNGKTGVTHTYLFELNMSGKGHERLYKITIDKSVLLTSLGVEIEECNDRVDGRFQHKTGSVYELVGLDKMRFVRDVMSLHAFIKEVSEQKHASEQSIDQLFNLNLT